MMSLLDVVAVMFIIAVLYVSFIIAFPKVAMFSIMVVYATFGNVEAVRSVMEPCTFGEY